MKISRKEHLLQKVVFIDGQAGCGKTLVNAIISSMKRVELLNYAPEIENLCILKDLNKISDDAVDTMIKIQMDLAIYETMMSRRVNFRPSDLSSAYKDIHFFKYLKRLFLKGDEAIPERIKLEKPILNFAVHNLLSISKPIFRSLKNKVKLIEVVRHPLYMIIQQTLNHINISKNKGSARQFRIYLENNKGYSFPYAFKDYHKAYKELKPVERAICEINNFTQKTEKFKFSNKKNNLHIMTFSFEDFVLSPQKYLNSFEKFLSTSISDKTRKTMKKQNIPRKKISDGIPLNIYKRCGWKPPKKNSSEKEELNIRRQYVKIQGARNKYINILDELSENYETKYFRSFDG